ncbi:MAG: translation initiation factor [Vicingaceae bacterium]|jgi:translation initiation factor 1|nr:translation initiation factor [Flavobacteriales bacterium]MBQ21133.1 translation initiation factor [Flavobacteriales bacterium]MDF1675380.1 translation initiation factor [Vicingaceae bacterium]|tara:strand:- start:34806 stop:35138 length:333 start_codon:yes stop_codon:yes gene_type:complete
MSKKNIVYSTNKNFEYEDHFDEEIETLSPDEQKLKVIIDRKQRKGKSVTLITGFVGIDDDLQDLGKILKQKCGVGGSAKDGEILIQGEHKDKIFDILLKIGYKQTKKVGG